MARLWQKRMVFVLQPKLILPINGKDMIKNDSLNKIALSVTTAILATCGAKAYEVPLTYFGTNLPPIDFHGFASQGFLASTKYNYLGDTTRGSFNFTEAGLNASINPFNRTHVTAQAFLFDVGKVGEYDLSLDYALVDYSFSDAFGIRAGRIIRPEGIYNSIQSIDLARTSVLLPQGLYDPRWRDFSGSVDGGSFYGDIGLGKAGDFSYEAYAGMVNPTSNGGPARQLEATLGQQPGATYEGNHGFPEVGAQFWWNTPLDGFRTGAGIFHAFGFSYDFNQEEFINPPGILITVPITGYVDATEGMASLEYVWKNWTFQAENLLVYYQNHEVAAGSTVASSHTSPDAWYIGAAYRFNKWMEAGSYYTEYYTDLANISGPTSAAYQTDLAVSLRFDPKPWWIIKVEGHFNHGTALLYDTTSNPVQNGDGWFMLALKTTVSF
jgi:hypothetical protein